MNRVVIVTGASRGLGARLAQCFADARFAVAVNYNENKDRAEGLVRSLREDGHDAVAIHADVSNPVEVRSMVDMVLSLWGRIDVLVNNAGVVSDALLVKTSNHVWEKIIGTNLSGVFTCIRAAAEIMIKQGGGHIINISSISGVHGQVGQAAYAASKAGILGLTMSAAKELGEYNVCVNTVLPGYLLTDMGISADKARDRAIERSVLHQLADVDETAHFVVNLAQMSGISGQVFNLDSRV